MGESDYPGLYQAADTLSLKAQRLFFRILFGNLSLLVIGAAISAANSQRKDVAVLQAVVLGGALGFAVLLSVMRPEKTWYAGRALAESVKTVSWRFMVRAEPFNDGEPASTRRFLDRLSELVKQNKEVAGKLDSHLSQSQITATMFAKRRALLQERHSWYATHRVEEQHQWYANKAQINKRRAAYCFAGMIAFNALALLCAILKIAYPTSDFWPTDIFVTIASGVVAWSQAKRFAELASSYALTANEIGILAHTISSASEAAFSDAVGDAENAFSREHTQWAARKDV